MKRDGVCGSTYAGLPGVQGAIAPCRHPKGKYGRKSDHAALSGRGAGVLRGDVGGVLGEKIEKNSGFKFAFIDITLLDVRDRVSFEFLWC